MNKKSLGKILLTIGIVIFLFPLLVFLRVPEFLRSAQLSFSSSPPPVIGERVSILEFLSFISNSVLYSLLFIGSVLIIIGIYFYKK